MASARVTVHVPRLRSLLDDYDAWRTARADLSVLEDRGEADADDWARSDDQGCDLARDFAAAVAKTLGVAWDDGYVEERC